MTKRAGAEQMRKKLTGGYRNGIRSGRRVIGEALKAFSKKTRTIFRINRRKNM